MTEIIKAGTHRGKRVFLVKLQERPGTIWLNDENVPEVLKRTFYTNRTLAGKKRKKRKK